jgi:hypothetical protein
VKRAPIVITATVAGLVGVLAFHTAPSRLSFGPVVGTPVTAQSRPAPAASRSAPRRGGGGSSSAPPAGSASSQPAARTVVGPAVNYNYGVLSVKITAVGNRISRVGIASINDGGMPRSQYIDQQAIPLLEQQAMQAQSANIQGVSGASYTSAGFAQSLQAALHTLGLR